MDLRDAMIPSEQQVDTTGAFRDPQASQRDEEEEEEELSYLPAVCVCEVSSLLVV